MGGVQTSLHQELGFGENTGIFMVVCFFKASLKWRLGVS